MDAYVERFRRSSQVLRFLLEPSTWSRSPYCPGRFQRAPFKSPTFIQKGSYFLSRRKRMIGSRAFLSNISSSNVTRSRIIIYIPIYSYGIGIYIYMHCSSSVRHFPAHRHLCESRVRLAHYLLAKKILLRDFDTY